jgi:hypothetical protein
LKSNRVEKRIKTIFLFETGKLLRSFETRFPFEIETLLLKRRLFETTEGGKF